MTEDTTRKAMFRWLTGSIMTSIKLMGSKQMRVFTRGMSMVFVNQLNRENGEPLRDGIDVDAAIEGYRKLEVASGQAEQDDVSVSQTPEGIQLLVKDCSYAGFCRDILPALTGTGEFSESTIPCMRCSNYSAALGLYNKTKWPYRLVQYAPGAKCTGVLKKL
ncbi:MAG: hypothetical protein BWX47_01515 [candidate division Hyd24-12 bacterium ADurb.Bin004]|nr:MAG: hypothetical protein BWX47_01515 [candidate division Hyd24-12 bacterium ADurb.Bin004]